MNRKVILLVFLNLTVLYLAATKPIAIVQGATILDDYRGTIVVPDDYSTIQEAVDNASSGDSVFVKSGTYKESVSITKSLSLIGEHKAKTIISGDWRLGGTVILVNHDDVTIKGFTIRSMAEDTHGNSIRGVHLLHVRRCLVSDCVFSAVGLGIWLFQSSDNIIEKNSVEGDPVNPTTPGALHFGFDGIVIMDSSCNNIFDNKVTGVYFSGIVMSNSVGNNLTGNYVESDYVGVSVGFSESNTIVDNKLSGTRYGIVQDSASNNTIADNTITDSATGIQINSSSCFNLIERNAISNSRYCGVEIHYNASHNMILGNTIGNNKHGMELKLSSNNILRDNNITGNLEIGVIIVKSSGNIINQSNFVKNGKHVSTDGSINTWDAGGKGNYWDDCSATDFENGALSKFRYSIDVLNIDNYPLIMPHVTSSSPIPSFPSQSHSSPPEPNHPTIALNEEPILATFALSSVAIAAAVVAGLLFHFKKHRRPKSTRRFFLN